MRLRLSILCMVLFCGGSLLVAQEQSVSIEQVRTAYEQLHYQRTVTLGEEYLANNPRISKESLLEVLQYIAFSQVALGKDEAAKRSLRSILITDPTFQLNENLASPKVTRVFTELKSEMQVSSTQPSSEPSHVILEDVKTAATLRSVIFPGSGQNYLNQHRGYVYNGIAAISLGVFVYSSIRVPTAHKDYLQATDPKAIADKYDTYNHLYQYRNNSLILYLSTWTLSLADVLVFGPSTQPHISLIPSESGVNLALNFRW